MTFEYLGGASTAILALGIILASYMVHEIIFPDLEGALK